MGKNLSFSNNLVKVEFIYDTEVGILPSSMILSTVDSDMPRLSYFLQYDKKEYIESLVYLNELLNNWITAEKQLQKKLNYADDSQFLFLFKNANIIGLPGNLKQIEDACAQEPFNCYPRFLNLLSQISITLDPLFINVIKGRFIWFFIEQMRKNPCAWSLDDVYKLAYYYDWTYLYSLYQIDNSTITNNKVTMV